MLYARLTELALAEQNVGADSSRAKGCPRAAFVGLGEHGFGVGFATSLSNPLRENAQHAPCAYRLTLPIPLCSGAKGNGGRPWPPAEPSHAQLRMASLMLWVP